MDEQKIVNELRTKGFAIAKGRMNNGSPDEWVMFGVWFHFKHNFYVDFDWRIGKYYFYVEAGKDIVKTKEAKNKMYDFYSAEDYLSSNLLKNFNILKEIAYTVHSSWLYITEDESVIKLFDNEDNRAVLFWIVDEYGDDTLYCVRNRSIPLMMFSPFAHREKLIDEAKRRGCDILKVRPCWAFDDDKIEDDEMEDRIIGFEEVDFIF